MAIQRDFGSYFSKISSSKKKDKIPDWILNIKRALDNQKKLKEMLKEKNKQYEYIEAMGWDKYEEYIRDFYKTNDTGSIDEINEALHNNKIDFMIWQSKDKEEMMNKIDKSINDLELKYKKAQLSYKEWRMKQDFEQFSLSLNIKRPGS